MSVPNQLADALMDASLELSCGTCHNAQSYLGDECPECHGEHRNQATISLFKMLCAEVCGFDFLAKVMRADGVTDDGMAR